MPEFLNLFEEEYTKSEYFGETEVSVLAASSPLWKGLVADDFKAYVEYEICYSLPNVIGPEMHGRVIGYHPQVLAASYRSLWHQQNNLGHQLKIYGAANDRIVGTVVGVSFPDMPEGGWVIPETVAQAPCMRVVAVVHKAAAGVDKLLGKHMTAKEKMSVSIESTGLTKDYAVYDPKDRSFVNITQAQEKFGDKILSFKKDKGLQLAKFEGRQLVLCPGGEDRQVSFCGVGYTPNPAEKMAGIQEIRAEMEDGRIMVAAMASPEWDAGMDVGWTPIFQGADAGRGTVLEVIWEGKVVSHGQTFHADPAVPLLRLKVHGKKLEVIRHATSVRKLAQAS